MVPHDHNNQGEVVTDPRYIYQNDANVIAYRLGIVETDLKGLDVKLDGVINEYPTIGTPQLILDPLREELRDLKEKREKEAEEKIKNSQQMKYLTYAAVAGPLGTFIVTIITAFILGDLGGNPSGG